MDAVAERCGFIPCARPNIRLQQTCSREYPEGKEASIIGGDERGNYILRHSDGSVRLWDHARGADEVLAPSVRAFLEGMNPPAS